ncbi:MAG: LCP family protein [Armatimonadetes bacterium]|nr:LCP family protein [Armatimonadota bacterium]
MARRLPHLINNNRGVAPILLVLLIILCFAAAVGLGTLLGYYTTHSGFSHKVKEIIEPPFDGKKTVRILVIGEDDTGKRNETKRGLSDSIIIASIDFDKQQVAALSIPRDTRVDLNGYGGMQKINAAHVFGGPMLTRLAVAQLTGIEADYYIKTNTKGFKKCVDILGGVEIDVEKNMRYIDKWGGLYINLEKGRQVLDGEHAMQYVRFRHDALGDISRIQRQQKFLRALVKKAVSPINLPKLPRLISTMLENVETDMTPRDLVALAKLASKLDLSQVEMETLPGAPQNINGISYWIADSQKTAEVVAKLFFRQDTTPIPAKIEVLNGSGVQGVAKKVAESLKQSGYEITSVGNAPSFNYTTSEIVCRMRTDKAARHVAEVTGISVIRRETDESVGADLTIIIGKDRALAFQGT